MTERIALAPVDSAEVQILVDNASDLLLRSDERAKRPSFADASGNGAPVTVEAPLMLDPRLPDTLVAEHGFSALVTFAVGGRTHRVMFDAGLSTAGLAHNLHALQIPLGDIEAVVMSHGHFDHIGGLNGLAREFGSRKMPMLLHPDFWLRRRLALPNAAPFELPIASRAAIEGAGFEVIEERRASLLLDGAVLITGEVDRTTEFEQGFAVHQAFRNGQWEPDPLILDDQALIANVRGRGLLVLTGCGHSGIVNIVRHAGQLTGETRVAAVIGGLHLNGPVFAASIEPTIAALLEIAPALLVPGHCTGFEATRAMSLAMADAFVQTSVGTRFVL